MDLSVHHYLLGTQANRNVDTGQLRNNHVEMTKLDILILKINELRLTSWRTKDKVAFHIYSERMNQYQLNANIRFDRRRDD